jgi:hypothetical protein
MEIGDVKYVRREESHGKRQDREAKKIDVSTWRAWGKACLQERGPADTRMASSDASTGHAEGDMSVRQRQDKGEI